MQPFESHIPYLLQFFQDFEISGMGWVSLEWTLTPFLTSFRLDTSGKYLTSLVRFLSIILSILLNLNVG
jgi:hypothetical protein